MQAASLYFPFWKKWPATAGGWGLVLLLSGWPFFLLKSQNLNLGTPPIHNFSKKNYKAGTQNWDMAQDARGVMFFANNDGMLEFDGTNWRLYPLTNNTIVRSVNMGMDEKIYVGGQGDFGYFSADGKGRLVYHSLKNLLPGNSRNFGDVWDILVRPEGVFFRANDRVFLLKGAAITAPMEGLPLGFMGLLDGKVLVQDANSMLHFFEENGFRPFGSTALPEGAIITGILAYHPDTQLITTIKHGIFYFSDHNFGAWKTQDDNFLKENRIYCAGLLEDGRVAVGTSLSGLVVLDRQRRIFHHLTKKNGLQNNTVLSIFSSRQGNLWLGLDNGTDLVDINSAFSTIFPDGGLEGTGYAVEIFDGKIYFGTNTGLYATDWKPYYLPGENQIFSRVANSSGQVWSLNRLGNSLLAGHHEGAFEVRDLTARKLAELPGIWKFLPLNGSTALAGHYNGVAFFKKKPNGWSLAGQPEGLAESSRILESGADGSIWMAHPYRGNYRLQADTTSQTLDVRFYDSENGLPTDFNNYVFKIGDGIVFAAEKGVFNFDEKQNRFVPNENFNSIFGGNTRVKYLRQDSEGHIWYVAGDEVGVLLVEDKALEKQVRRQHIPELSGRLTGGFEFILPLDEHNVFFATEQGFIHFDPTKYPPDDASLSLVLHEVRLEGKGDSLLFGGHPGAGTVPAPVLSHRQNTLRFTFSATDFTGSEFLQYAHFLEGSETGWSDWNSGTTLVFNNLRPGSYRLRLKARNGHGTESGEFVYGFSILPPWYASRLAFIVYGLLALGMVGGVLFGQRKRFDKERQALQTTHRQREEQHQQFARQSEEAINRLQQEKLEAEVQHKNQELATATMHLVQKSEILNSIKMALEKLEKDVSGEPALKREIHRIVKMVDQDASLDEDWEQFSKNFDQVHSDFLKRLGDQYPQLSSNDFKLSAYLRMNLSTKEIASLLNISVRGVEASRYRLRKRLGLGTNVNLTEFLMRF